MVLTVDELVARLGGRVVGDGARTIAGVAPLDQAGPADISFLANPKYRSQLFDTNAGVVILDEKTEVPEGRTAIHSENPYLYFARAVALMHPSREFSPGISERAVVLGDVAESVHVAPGVVIEAGARVFEGAVIGPNCVIGHGAHVGRRTRLMANVTVYEGCTIGDDCIIHSGAVIGADGFGFARDARLEWVKFPQIGSVRIGNKVEIGANTTIDRGAMADTVISDGVKIDNLVQIGHNVEIGEHTVIAGAVGIAGSTKIGKRCMLGGQAGVSGHLSIGDDVVISGGSAVTKSISKPGQYTANLPIQAHTDWVRNFAHLRHLDSMAKKIRTIEKRLDKGEDES